MFVSNTIANKVTSNFESSCGNALMCLLEGIGLGPMGLVNIYTPHSPTERTIFLEYLCRQLDPTRLWITSGDWNMIEYRSNYLGANITVISRLKRGMWETWILDFALQDFHYKILGEPFYTWDNRRVEIMLNNGEVSNPASRVHKRLDRFHVSSAFGDVAYYICIRCLTPQVLFDHIPLCIKLSSPVGMTSKHTIFCMNTKYLTDEGL